MTPEEATMELETVVNAGLERFERIYRTDKWYSAK